MLVIPAIDLRGGRCVRLHQGDFGKETVYEGDPVEIAVEFERAGARWIHVVDLDAARSGDLRNLDLVRAICQAVTCGVEVGGGVRSQEAAETLLEAGATRVVLGTVLVTDPAFAKTLFRQLGERVVAGIDARDGKVAVQGWLAEGTMDAIDLAAAMGDGGARRIIFTDIARDGALVGPNLELLAKVVAATRAKVIASGGVGDLNDLRALAAMPAPGVEGAIVGKAIYEGRVSVREAVETVQRRS